MGRVLLGGLVAGVVYNIGEAILNMQILSQAMLNFSQKFNLPPALRLVGCLFRFAQRPKFFKYYLFEIVI